MKKNIPIFSLMFLLCSLFAAYGQGYSIWPWPWGPMEECALHFLPGGGWNTPASFSPRGLAMGETYLSARNASAGYLNPAYLSSLSDPQFSLSYRYTENRYKTSFMKAYVPMVEIYETRSFRRETDYLDSAGLALPLDKLVLAGNYFLFQEFNFPDIRGVYFEYSQTVIQSGDLKGLNVALAYRVTEVFSLGGSVSYVFGDIRRVQELPEVYYVLPENSSGQIPSFFEPYPTTTQKYGYDAKGLFFNLGFTWEPSEQVILGFSLRPPFSLNIQTELELTDSAGQRTYLSEENYLKYPLVAVTSVLFHPSSSFLITADLSYWGWGSFSTDLDLGWFYNYDFQSVFKLNLGVEYKISLPFDLLNRLELRAGYIYDPQPYRHYANYDRIIFASQPYTYNRGFAKNYVTFGLCLPVGRFDFDFTAKMSVSAREYQRFYADVLQVGAGYRF